MISQQINSVVMALAGAERIFEVLDTESEIKDAENAIESFESRGNLKFDDVTFYYKKDEPVLDGVTFDIKSGSIKIDDVDIREFSLKSLHKNIKLF